MRVFAAASPLLADATMLMAFAKVGAARCFLDYVGRRTVVVRDVLEELRRQRGRFVNVGPLVDFFDTDDERRLLDLTPEHVLAVDDVVDLYRTPWDRASCHRGEVATVFGALQLQGAGRRVLVGTDDHLGKLLCRQRRLRVADTPRLLVEMVCRGAMPYETGSRVWRAGLFDDNPGNWRAYGERVREACGD